MISNKIKMDLINPNVRINTFDEVTCGYDFDSAKLEASRCLQCKKPKCVSACPVGINIPLFIDHIKNNKIENAYHIILEDNVLPSVCGRVCPQEKQCEAACVIGIKGESVAIGALERFVGDYALKMIDNIKSNKNQKTQKIAIIGSGPAGLAAAYELKLFGYNVTIFEALHEFGGVLQYGIPSFRLPKDIVKKEVERLKKTGVIFRKNVLVGKTITIDQMKNDLAFDAIFIGAGAGLPISLNIPGENYAGVYYANEFLTRVNLMKANQFPKTKTPIRIGKNIIVIGGGNVAMDAARTARRLGAKNVTIVYRRDFDSLPARYEEIIHAQEEGINFQFLLSPIKITGENYQIQNIVCEKMVLGEKDQSNRRRPISTGEFITIKADTLIISIGQRPNPILPQYTKCLEIDKKGYIKIDETYQTTIDGVFAGGDVVSGAGTVIHAMGQGKEAAKNIDLYLNQKK